MSGITLRPETSADYGIVEALVEAAFKNAEHTDGREHLLVKALRQSTAYIPDLSLVAEENGALLGHVLLTHIVIRNASGNDTPALALAPVSVAPEMQNKGIGGLLILAAHERARTLGYKAVIVLGHPSYYPRFGYTPASRFGIKAPFDVVDANFMALELQLDALQNSSGIVEYAAEFGI